MSPLYFYKSDGSWEMRCVIFYEILRDGRPSLLIAKYFLDICQARPDGTLPEDVQSII